MSEEKLNTNESSPNICLDCCGLVLEGGGLKGVYTAGVLDYFLEQDIHFKSIIGVSAGAYIGATYICGQYKHAIKCMLKYLYDNRFYSVSNLMSTGDFFNVKMLYDLIPNKLCPLNYDAFRKANCCFYSVVTNCKTGKAEFKKICDLKKDMIWIRASCSLPLLSRTVNICGVPYLDGGIACSLPLEKSQSLGNAKNVIILTQPLGYRKSFNQFMGLISNEYRCLPNLVSTLGTRHINYNKSLDKIESLEKKGKVFVFRPSTYVDFSPLERNRQKLSYLYNTGRKDAMDNFEKLIEFLQ